MKENKFFIAVLIFFAGCLFGIEPIIVMPYLDGGVLKEYFFFTFVKFNTALLVFWILHNRYIFRRDSLETSEKIKKRKKYKFILYVICLMYFLYMGLYIITGYIIH